MQKMFLVKVSEVVKKAMYVFAIFSSLQLCSTAVGMFLPAAHLFGPLSDLDSEVKPLFQMHLVSAPGFCCY